MGIIKVLKRKDGASLVIGVALGFMVYVFASAVTSQLAEKLTGISSGVGESWKVVYLTPAVVLLLELVALELLIWVYAVIHSAISGNK